MNNNFEKITLLIKNKKLSEAINCLNNLSDEEKKSRILDFY